MLPLIGHNDKTPVGYFQFLSTQFVTQLSQTGIKPMASRVFTKHQIGIAPANGLRSHYFVRQAVFEHTILMDACFMRKGVRSHDGFIGMHGDTRQLTDQLAGWKNLLRSDTSID